MRKITSKEKLAEAFYKLCQEQPVDKITVQSITLHSGLSYPTFYNHFQDKYDLLCWMYERQASRLFKKLKSGTLRELIEDGIDQITEHKEFNLNAYQTATGSGPFIDFAADVYTRLATGYLEKKAKKPVNQELESLLKIYCYGVIHFIFHWLKDMDLSRDEIIDYAIEAMPEPLRRAMN